MVFKDSVLILFDHITNNEVKQNFDIIDIKKCNNSNNYDKCHFLIYWF